MRSNFSRYAAVVFVLGYTTTLSTTAQSADPKSKAASSTANKKKQAELLTDDKAISSQMQWEQQVMGDDDKRAELQKIQKAAAMAKAAEKAAAEKAAAEKLAAEKAAKEPPKPTHNTKAEIAVPSLPDEEETKPKAKPTQPSASKMADDTPAPQPTPTKPADNQFIDKLMKGDAAPKTGAARANDRELEQLLANELKEKQAAKPKAGGKRDDVINLLESASKEPERVATKPKPPSWAKPDVPAPPPPPPSPILKPQPKKDDGIIRVVQGARGTMSAPPPPPAKPAPVASKPAPSAAGQGWNDPFEQGYKSSSTKRQDTAPVGRNVAVRSTVPAKDPFADGTISLRSASRAAPAPKPVAARLPPPPPPAPRAAPVKAKAASGWKDPFADGFELPAKPASAPAAAPVQRKKAEPAPARSAFKDPFSDSSTTNDRTAAPSEAPRPGASRWAAAAHRPAKAAGSSEPRSRWSVLKKRRK